MNFEQVYIQWLKDGRKNQVGAEFVPLLLEWLKQYNHQLIVCRGYGLDYEVQFYPEKPDPDFDAPAISFNITPVPAVHVFPRSNHISPNFIAISGNEARELAYTLKSKVESNYNI
jgi:hypothetical protein